MRARFALVSTLRFLNAFLLLAAVCAAFDASPAICRGDEAPGDKEEGFTSLCGPDAAKQWTGYSLKAGEWPKSWSVADGVLHCTGGGKDLVTSELYADFDFRFEWKVSPGGNSGVMYRVSQDQEQPYFTGPEYQVIDNPGWKLEATASQAAGGIYELYPPTKDVAKPAGEWNTGRIVLENNRLQHYLNGQLVAEAVLASDDWNKRVAASKFDAWKKFGKNPTGHLDLQDHGQEVWYRNLRVKALKAKAEK
jgi:hypothetical protein